uniref:Membrane protein BRI3 n=1 Tax=Plectus sambesii TaxID=2011161 RepID=A0A914VE32_9BILA
MEHPAHDCHRPRAPRLYFIPNVHHPRVHGVPTAFIGHDMFVHAGNCPTCPRGFVIERTSTCGLVMIILFCVLCFPIGVVYLCCIPYVKERRCSNCGHKV